MKPRPPFQRIDVAGAETLLSRRDPLVLDARDAGSFAKSRIDGAQPVSSANLGAVIGATAKTRPILIYCYHGNASREYAQTFSDFGFMEVYSLDGGYEAWRTRPPCAGADLAAETPDDLSRPRRHHRARLTEAIPSAAAGVINAASGP